MGRQAVAVHLFAIQYRHTRLRVLGVQDLCIQQSRQTIAHRSHNLLLSKGLGD